MKKITVITWMLMFMYFFSGAQDVTLPGSGCGGGAVSGAWTVPCNVTAITIEVYGSGGGGGGRGGGSNGGFFDTRAGGGGGGGGYTSISINVVPGSSFNYNVGPGGCGGDGDEDGRDGDGGSGGGASTFTGSDASATPVNLTANGGGGGGGGDGTEGSEGGGGGGGSASGGTTNNSGAPGIQGNGDNGGAGGAGAGPSGSGGTGGGDPGGNGGAGGILITYTATTTIPVPVIDTIAASCSADGSASVANYDVAYTYQVSPAGTVDPGGAISGLAPGTPYTVEASIGTCFETSAPFSIDPASPLPAPVIDTLAASCTADGSATIINYDPALSYDFDPDLSPPAGGVISGMVPGTPYMVTASGGGCPPSASSAPFSIDAQLPAPVASFSGSLSYCTGANTTLTATGGIGFSYEWRDAGLNIISTVADVAVTQGVYTLEVTDASNCTDDTTATVTETPGPSVVLAASPMQICVGQSVMFTADPPGYAAYEFLLNGVSVQSGPSDSYSTSSLVQGDLVTARAFDQGCFGPESNTALVTVLQVGTALVTVSAQPDTICTGQSVTFTANPPGYDAYEFLLNGLSVQNSPSNTYTTSSLVQGDVITARASDQGCFGPESTPVSVTVLQVGTATVTLSVSPDSICTGQNVTFTASSTGFLLYEFLLNGTVVQTDVSNTFSTTTLVQGDVVTARASDQLCFGPESNPVSVTILQIGTAVVSLSASEDSICIGQAVTFTATPAGFGVYEFLRNGISVQSGTSNTYSTSTLIQADTLTVRASDQGCFGPVSNQVHVIVIPALTVDAGDDIARCPDDPPVTLQGFSPLSGTWAGTGITDPSGIFDPETAGSGIHSLTYSVIDASGCSGADDIEAQVYTPARTNFSATPLIVELKDSTSVEFSDLTTGAITWQWDFGDESTSNIQNPTHIYSDTGFYTVTLITTDANGCADTLVKTNYVLVQGVVYVFVPNAFSPNNDAVNDELFVIGKGISDMVFRIYNRWGEMVFESRNINDGWDGTYRGKLLPPDVYVYRLEAEFTNRKTERLKGSVTLLR